MPYNVIHKLQSFPFSSSFCLFVCYVVAVFFVLVLFCCFIIWRVVFELPLLKPVFNSSISGNNSTKYDFRNSDNVYDSILASGHGLMQYSGVVIFSVFQGGLASNNHIPLVRVDPDGRCAAMLVYGRQLVILPFRKEAIVDVPDTGGASRSVGSSIYQQKEKIKRASLLSKRSKELVFCPRGRDD